jgi:hypothetical protein
MLNPLAPKQHSIADDPLICRRAHFLRAGWPL